MDCPTRAPDRDGRRPARPRAFLNASRKDDGTWHVSRDELERFIAARRPAKAVIGYDVTFSAPKSVSILWAVADAHTQREIADAVESAVDAGLRYLESVTSTRAPTRPVLRGLVAAAFLHGTSRNLDPQLHVHAIVANLAMRPDDECRALDGRDLFAHAKTAGYLAAAHLRHECTKRFGWRWGPVIHGLADVDGVPAEAIRAMSSRRQEIESLATEMGVHSAPARQVAAYRTRTAKEAVAPDALRADWDQRLTEAGFDDAARAKCFAPGVEINQISDDEREALLAHLASAHGVTERTAVFDRRHVIQAAAAWSQARLSASEILDIADAFLASEQAIPLARADGEVIRLRGGRIAPAARGLARYSTPAMLAAERQVLDAFDQGVEPRCRRRCTGGDRGRDRGSTQPRRRPSGDGASDLHVGRPVPVRPRPRRIRQDVRARRRTRRLAARRLPGHRRGRPGHRRRSPRPRYRDPGRNPRVLAHPPRHPTRYRASF